MVIREVVGAEPSEFDGRTAFLLAFAKAIELEVTLPRGGTETVNVLFCGTADEPLLVQRIGKARAEAAAAAGAAERGASGAAAVPSLGYVQVCNHRPHIRRNYHLTACNRL